MKSTDKVHKDLQSVAISGNIAIVGAPGDDSSKGSAYIFTNNGGIWSQIDKLIADDGALGDSFGWSVAICGNTAIISAPGDKKNIVSNVGSAYIFTNNDGVWIQKEKLITIDGAENDNFGKSVAIGSYGSIVGADGDSSNTGAVYSYIPFGCVDSKLQIKKIC
jgi:hypothetical protein